MDAFHAAKTLADAAFAAEAAPAPWEQIQPRATPPVQLEPSPTPAGIQQAAVPEPTPKPVSSEQPPATLAPKQHDTPERSTDAGTGPSQDDGALTEPSTQDDRELTAEPSEEPVVKVAETPTENDGCGRVVDIDASKTAKYVPPHARRKIEEAERWSVREKAQMAEDEKLTVVDQPIRSWLRTYLLSLRS